MSQHDKHQMRLSIDKVINQIIELSNKEIQSNFLSCTFKTDLLTLTFHRFLIVHGINPWKMKVRQNLHVWRYVYQHEMIFLPAKCPAVHQLIYYQPPTKSPNLFHKIVYRFPQFTLAKIAWFCLIFLGNVRKWLILV